MKNPDIVTASQIGNWAFCPEALRLREFGSPTANQAHLDAGDEFHADLGQVERIAGGAITPGQILIVLALLALAWAVLRG
jgi:hypothetical protein